MNGIAPTLLALSLFTATLASGNELKYSCAPNFFEKDPGNQMLGPCHGGLLIDKSGNIYVSTDTPRGIVVYSPQGKFLRACGPTRLHGLEMRQENGVEYIYGARPNDHEVVKLTLDGQAQWTLEFPKVSGLYKDANEFKPCAVTLGPDGAIFVADGYGANYVLKFDKDRKFIKAFGGPGEAEGKFQTCHGIAFDGRQEKPLIFVCNRNNNRVEHWDLDGNFVCVIQKDLHMPAAVHIRGGYALVPELQGRVTVLNKDGSIAAQLGDNPNEKQRANFGLPQSEWKDGICNSPHGGSIDQ